MIVSIVARFKNLRRNICKEVLVCIYTKNQSDQSRSATATGRYFHALKPVAASRSITGSLGDYLGGVSIESHGI